MKFVHGSHVCVLFGALPFVFIMTRRTQCQPGRVLAHPLPISIRSRGRKTPQASISPCMKISEEVIYEFPGFMPVGRVTRLAEAGVDAFKIEGR